MTSQIKRVLRQLYGELGCLGYEVDILRVGGGEGILRVGVDGVLGLRAALMVSGIPVVKVSGILANVL